MVLGGEPLLHKNGDEKGRQHKVDALEADGDQRPGETAQHRACHPVDLVEKGYQQAVAVPVRVVVHLLPGDQGVGLVRQGEDQIGLGPGALVAIHHGDAVKEVPGVDHQAGQCGDQQAGSAGHQAHRHILHGAGVDKDAHSQGPEDAVAVFAQENAEAEAQEEVAGHHGDRVQKGPAKEVFVHKIRSLCVKIK